jgi:hypothetical protein
MQGLRAGIGAAVAAILLGYLVWLFVHREEPVVKQSQVLLTAAHLLGGFLFAVATVVSIVQPASMGCVALDYISMVSFHYYYSSLAVKTWRIQKIFTARKLKPIQNSDVMLRLHFYLMVDALVLSVAILIDFPQVDYQPVAGQAYLLIAECTSEGYNTALNVMAAWRAILLLYGAFLAYQVRNINEQFGEAAFLFVTTWAAMLFAIIVQLVYGGVAGTTKAIVLVVALVGGVLMPSSLNIWHKYRNIYHTDANASKNGGVFNGRNPMPSAASTRVPAQSNTSRVSIVSQVENKPPEVTKLASPISEKTRLDAKPNLNSAGDRQPEALEMCDIKTSNVS